MTETYLVTGGAGFIGSNIAQRLLDEGHHVRVVDNFLTGREAIIAPLLERPGFTLHRLSLTDTVALPPAFDGVDYVIHQAALPSVPRSIAAPLDTHQHCVTATLNVLYAAQQAGVRRVVYASSSSVYGDVDTEYKVETLPPNPRTPYAAAKLAGEYYCRVFTDTYGLETVALRYFNVFGPNQDPTSAYAAVIPRFVTRMLAGQAPIIYGDGGQSRDFTYVDNVVQANLLAARAPQMGAVVLNVAMGGSISLLQLVADLNAILGTDFTPQHEPDRAGDIRHSRADISAAQRLLGYAPTVSFREGLRRTVDWLRQTATA